MRDIRFTYDFLRHRYCYVARHFYTCKAGFGGIASSNTQVFYRLPVASFLYFSRRFRKYDTDPDIGQHPSFIHLKYPRQYGPN